MSPAPFWVEGNLIAVRENDFQQLYAAGCRADELKSNSETVDLNEYRYASTSSTDNPLFSMSREGRTLREFLTLW